MRPMQAFSKRQINGLSLESEILMDIVYSQRKIQVMNLIKIAIDTGVASHATIHKALKDAIDLGFMEMQASKQDLRLRFCLITDKGRDYIKSY